MYPDTLITPAQAAELARWTGLEPADHARTMSRAEVFEQIRQKIQAQHPKDSLVVDEAAEMTPEMWDYLSKQFGGRIYKPRGVPLDNIYKHWIRRDEEDGA